MKIAVFCPLGPLDRYGYQRIFRETLGSMSQLADEVVLVSTTRDSSHHDAVLSACPNATFISDSRTWFEVDESGVEVFDPAKPVDGNAQLAATYAASRGLDCLIEIHVNQYVPETAVDALRSACRAMHESRRPFEWLYHRYQLRDRLFETESRRPWIVNLTVEPRHEFAIDGLRASDASAWYSWEHGDYRTRQACALVDVPLELTFDDLEAKMNFVRCYSDLNPAGTSVFDMDVVLPYYVEKFRSRGRSDAALDPAGGRLAAASKPNFVSWAVIDELDTSSERFLSRMRRCLRGGA